MKNHFIKFIHILENMNIATPWQDWDHHKCSVKQFRMKHRKVNIEMAFTMMVNILISMLMAFPLVYTGKHIIFFNFEFTGCASSSEKHWHKA